MANVPSITVDWTVSPRLITIPAPITEVTVQDLYDTLRFREELQPSYTPIVSAGGKEALGAGTSVAVTLTLLNAVISWGTRVSNVVTKITGGNIVAVDSVGSPIDVLTFTDKVNSFIAQSSSATVTDVSLTQRQQYFIESQRDSHSGYGDVYFWDPVNGDNSNDGTTVSTACATFAYIQTNLVTSGNRDVVFLVGSTGATTIVTEPIVITKDHLMLRGPGRGVCINSADDSVDTIVIDGAFGVELDSLRVNTGPGPTARRAVFVYNGSKYSKISNLWIDVEEAGEFVTGTGLHIEGGSHHRVEDVFVKGAGGIGICFDGTVESEIAECRVYQCGGDGVELRGSFATQSHTSIDNNILLHNTGFDLNLADSGVEDTAIRLLNNFADDANVNDQGTRTNFERVDLALTISNRTWASAIYLSADQGSAGTQAHVNGTRSNPSNNIADATTLANAIGTKDLVVQDGSYVLAGNYVGWSFTGVGDGNAPIIDVNGNDVSQTKFELIRVTGDAAGSTDLRLFTCSMTNFTDWCGIANECILLDNISVCAGSTLMANSGSATPEPLSSAVIDTMGSAVVLQLRNWVGPLTLSNLSHASALVAVDMHSGIVTLPASDTAGTVTISGTGDVVDSSVGTTVITDRLVRPAVGVKRYLVMDNMVFNANKMMTSARERVFGTKAAADAATPGAPGTEGAIEVYDIVAVESATPGIPATYSKIRTT